MFYTYNVDIASPKSMWNFLREHFQYPTLNSWNGERSIAHNVKLYNLKLDGDWTVALRFMQDEADSGALQIQVDELTRDFEDRTGYRVGFNGRSGGYLVLYNPNDYRSVLPEWITNYMDYAEFKEDTKNYYGSCIKDFKDDLVKYVTLVREFDRLCDTLRDLMNDYSQASFDEHKLEDAVGRFCMEYEDDLEALGLEGPVIIDDYVELNDVADYNAFMNCFYQCLGDDKKRAYVNGSRLYLKEG
jgi:hypothetical protein